MKPSDSIRHQLLKYLEDRANRTFSTTTSAPPPPYTTNPSSISNTPRIPTMYTPKNIYYNEDYDYNYDWDEPSPTAISITIDSSITIDGDKNTVTVSSPRADALASDATHSNIDSTNTNTNANANGKHLAHTPEQMSQLTTTIINALQSQGLTEEKGRKRPLTLTLKRGIVIKGSDNTVCMGRTRLPVSSSSVYDDGDGDTIRSASTVSRRTCSVCMSDPVVSSQKIERYIKGDDIRGMYRETLASDVGEEEEEEEEEETGPISGEDMPAKRRRY